MQHFSGDEWFSLPKKFRSKWWEITDFGAKAPPEELVEEAKKLLRPNDPPPSYLTVVQ